MLVLKITTLINIFFKKRKKYKKYKGKRKGKERRKENKQKINKRKQKKKYLSICTYICIFRDTLFIAEYFIVLYISIKENNRV